MTSFPSAHDSLPPFCQPGQWFRGNLHVHSTTSDGQRTPDQVIDWYRMHDYQFLALTDHRTLSEGRVEASGFVVLSGIEVDGRDEQAGLYHVVGVGLQREPDLGEDTTLSMQLATSRLLAAGGLVFLAHPYWSGQMSKDLLDLEGCLGIEVYNGGCEVDDARGFSSVHWDDLLAAGRRLSGIAVDDAHWRNGTKDAGLGWVWVKAPTLTPQAVLDALASGSFYASSGPRLLDLRYDPGARRVSVCCSPVVSIDFVGNRWLSRRITAPPGQTLTQASHELYDGQTYVRVACLDSAGHWAWSNPVFVGV